MSAAHDDITISTESGAAFDRWTAVEILNSVVRSNEASFEVGDDGSWRDLSELAAIGTPFTVAVNGSIRVKGRVEVLNSPLSAQSSSTVRFIVRTVLSDLEYCAADVRVRVKDRSIRDVIEAVIYSTELDIPRLEIQYRGDVSRELLTGRKTRGGAPAKDLEPLKVEQAAVQPGETVKAFIDRHLMRHGLLLWESPDGKLVISAPDDDQEETYVFRCLRGAESKYNNVLSIDRTRDASGAPTDLYVFGYSGGKDFRRAKVSGRRLNDELIQAGFRRSALIVEDGIKTKELAERTAARAFSERTRKLDTFVIAADGLSYRERGGSVQYAADACCGIVADTIGGAVGKYYIEQVLLRRTPEAGDVTQLQTVKAGTWRL
ncbi:MAG: hypothetical protein ACOY0T_37475 [Myxococcota bacterium]